MEQLPNWLVAAVAAAGMTTAYNAEDWKSRDNGVSVADSEVPPTLMT